MQVVSELWAAMAISGKAIVGALIILSVYSYGVMIDRGLALRWVRRRSADFAAETESRLAQLSIDEVVEKAAEPKRSRFFSLASVVAEALRELKTLLSEGQPPSVVVQGVDDAAGRAVDIAASNLRARLAGLASIAAVSPFLGLFGTVTGLITAFRGIAETGAGGMATVSGGISEALVTTAVGLFVAIPALWAYNYFVNRIDVYSLELETKSARILGYLVRRGLAARGQDSEPAQ